MANEGRYIPDGGLSHVQVYPDGPARDDQNYTYATIPLHLTLNQYEDLTFATDADEAATNLRVSQISSSINTTITNVSSSINSTIGSVSSSIDSRITNVSSSIDSRITNVSSSINSTIGSVSSSINSTIGSVSSSISNGTIAASFDTVAAMNNGNGTNFKVGDDAWIGDVNAVNTFQVSGIQNPTAGHIRFGSGSLQPTIGHNGNGGFPAIGQPQAVTGSILSRGAHLYFFNGTSSNNGWAQII